MTESLRIAVADDEPRMRAYYQESLTALGHEVVAVAGTGAELVEKCRQVEPQLVITDIKMPDMDGIQASTAICRDRPVPVVLVSAYHDPELLERALEDHVLAYLVKPIKRPDLTTAIGVAMRRFREFSALRQEASDLRQALEDRKVIERAKGILMKRGELDEPEAFTRLQKLSRDKNRKLIEIARSVVTAEEAIVGR